MSAERFDVIVVGGGPGGTSTGIMLAKRGYKVLLLERERFPRFHIGESLLPALWDLWDELGVTAEMEAVGFVIKQGINFAMFEPPTEIALLTGEFPRYFQRPYTYHVERARYDQIMLEHARRCGVDAREEWTVEDVLFEGDRCVGVVAGPNGQPGQPYHAPMVVDATGRNCLMSRKLGWRKPDPTLNKLSHFTHYQGADPRDHDGTTMTEIHSIDGGWIWYIPLTGDIVSVGAVLDAKAFGSQKGPQARFDHAVAGCPKIREWVEGARQTIDMHTISNISYLNDSFVGNGFVLVGDASMFVDPIFSAGVTIAVRGGIFAAECIHDCFQRGDFSAERMSPYEARIRLPMSRIFRMIYNWYGILEKKDPNNLIARSRRVPLLRERLIVLFSGGYDKIDMEAILQAAGADAQGNPLQPA
ncbi:MAG: tryptophan 7-halogenase [Gemmatimonadetes bacterium]|nr:tryptophan 7-halogenase [Gemmatimonadota bacterium]